LRVVSAVVPEKSRGNKKCDEEKEEQEQEEQEEQEAKEHFGLFASL